MLPPNDLFAPITPHALSTLNTLMNDKPAREISVTVSTVSGLLYEIDAKASTLADALPEYALLRDRVLSALNQPKSAAAFPGDRIVSFTVGQLRTLYATHRALNNAYKVGRADQHREHQSVPTTDGQPEDGLNAINALAQIREALVFAPADLLSQLDKLVAELALFRWVPLGPDGADLYAQAEALFEVGELRDCTPAEMFVPSSVLITLIHDVRAARAGTLTSDLRVTPNRSQELRRLVEERERNGGHPQHFIQLPAGHVIGLARTLKDVTRGAPLPPAVREMERGGVQALTDGRLTLNVGVATALMALNMLDAAYNATLRPITLGKDAATAKYLMEQGALDTDLPALMLAVEAMREVGDESTRVLADMALHVAYPARHARPDLGALAATAAAVAQADAPATQAASE